LLKGNWILGGFGREGVSLGYKGEMHGASGTFFDASDRSRLELLGGLYCVRPGPESSLPLAVSRDSQIALDRPQLFEPPRVLVRDVVMG